MTMSDEFHSWATLWAQYSSRVASLVAVLVGTVALAGWALNIRILASLIPGQTSMRPNSAAAYILAGIALWILQAKREVGRPAGDRRWIGRAFAIIVILSGAITLSEYLFSMPVGIDQVLFRDPEIPISGLSPGRMTPTGALTLVFIGCALLLLDVRKRRGTQITEFLAFVVILDGMYGLFDFMLHPSVSLTGIAPGSAFVSCVLGSGLLAARPDHVFRQLLTSDRSGGAVFRRLLPAALAVPLVLTFLIWTGNEVGLFAGNVGLTMLVVMTITAFVWIVMWTTESLDEADLARQTAVTELNVRVRQQAAIAELGHRALAGVDVALLMNDTIELVARTLGVEFCKVQELLPDGKELMLRAATGWEDGLVGHAITEARAESQAGYTLMSDRPVVVEDLRAESRFIPSPLLTSRGVISGLSVIVAGKDRPFGVLGAHTTRHRRFTDDDVHFLQAAANILAAAIDRKRTEIDLRRFNRALRTLSECDLAMVRATSEPELLKKVCNILVDQGGYRMAWVGYAEQDENKTIRAAAFAGAEEGYLESARITWGDDERGRGPTGTAIRSGRAQVVRNILEDRNFAPWREDAAKHGYASTAALPLRVEGRPLGVLRVYAEAPDAFDEEEMSLLSGLAGDLAYGIQALRTRAAAAQANEALRENEERFRQMAENIREVLWMVDASGAKILYVSPSYEKVWGRPPGAPFEHRLAWLNVIHPEDRHRVRTTLGGDILRKETETEFRVVWPDGSVHWIRDRSFPVRGAGGEVTRIVGISEDITERRLAADALLESEERFRQLFNEMNVGCALCELVCDGNKRPCDARFVEVNPTFERMTGFAKSFLVGKSLREVFPRVESGWVERLGRVALTGESTHFEDYSRAFKKYLDVTAFRPRPGYFAAVFADITQRMQAQKALEEAELKYRSIFEHAVEGIFQVREDGGLLTANPAMARLLGYASVDEFTREVRNIEQHLYIEPRHPSGFIPLLRQQGKISEFETLMRRRDGTVIWVIGSAYAVRDESGRALYYEGTLRDITEHKRVEEALRQLSSQLLHAQDDERRRIARELHDSTGQYLAALSMNLSWMDQSVDGSQPKVRTVVGESIELVKRCLAEIRNFSYLLHPPVLDEYGLSAALQWYVQGFSKRSGIEVELDVEAGLPRLARQAETALYRVVQECLTNVHRHSGSSRARIHLHHDSRSLTLEVADQGHGIPAPPAGQAGAEGTGGVGIAGIKERMRELGGHLEIESDPKGTTVRASLPLEIEEVAS
jgi:PAS domain S-box-containing protein